MSTAKLLDKRTHQVPGKLLTSEYFFQVPLDHAHPRDDTLKLFARSVERFERPVDASKADTKQLPWCTGLSSTVTAQTLAKHGGPEEQADYLRYFRADSIVEDCEAIRKVLTADYPDEKKKWSIIGQSFGGFCCMNYLSAQVSILTAPASTAKVAERNRAYYNKYAEDMQRVKNIVHYLQTEDVKLPSGDTILRMASDLNNFGYFTAPTLSQFEGLLPFDTLPLYALVHELIYLQG
ncbi:MAG: hypothetical protein Q9196_007101 [Gyalolechia fulgens]